MFSTMRFSGPPLMRDKIVILGIDVTELGTTYEIGKKDGKMNKVGLTKILVKNRGSRVLN